MKKIVSLFLVLSFIGLSAGNAYPAHDSLRPPIDGSAVEEIENELQSKGADKPAWLDEAIKEIIDIRNFCYAVRAAKHVKDKDQEGYVFNEDIKELRSKALVSYKKLFDRLLGLGVVGLGTEDDDFWKLGNRLEPSSLYRIKGKLVYTNNHISKTEGIFFRFLKSFNLSWLIAELTPQRIRKEMPRELIVNNDLMLSIMRGAVYFELTEYFGLNEKKALKKAKALVRSTVGEERELGAGKKTVSVSFGGTRIRDCYINDKNEREYQSSTTWKDETKKLTKDLSAKEIEDALFVRISKVIDKAGKDNVENVQIGLPGQPDVTGKIACDDGKNPQLPALFRYPLGSKLGVRLKGHYGKSISVVLKNDCTLSTEYEMSEKGTFKGRYNSVSTFLNGSGTNIEGIEDGIVYTGKGIYEGVMLEPAHKITAKLGDFNPKKDHFTSRLEEWKGDKFPPKEEIDKKYLRLEAAIQGSALNKFAREYGYYVPTPGDNNKEGLPDLTEAARKGDEKARTVIELFTIIAGKGYASFIATGDNINAECYDHTALISTVFQKLGKGVGFTFIDQQIEEVEKELEYYGWLEDNETFVHISSGDEVFIKVSEREFNIINKELYNDYLDLNQRLLELYRKKGDKENVRIWEAMLDIMGSVKLSGANI